MSKSVDLLNQLLHLHVRSLAMYVSETAFWRGAASQDADFDRALRALVLDQRTLGDRIAQAITGRYGAVRPGSYAMEFTDKQDLAVEYLLGEALNYERRALAVKQSIRQAIPAGDAEAVELVDEAIGAAKGHIESLEKLAAKPVGA